MSQFSTLFGCIVATIGFFASVIIGIFTIIDAWGFLGLIVGIPILLVLIPIAPLWLWWIGDGFPVAFTMAWAVAFAGTLYLMVFHKDSLR
tara:strand:+ start:896 stop:1165 length:270 start_codon:yes stop_codon:yes gene_type:complete